MRHLDFQRATAEKKGEPITLTVAGETFTLPATITAAAGLELLAMAGRDANDSVTSADLKPLVFGVFGERQAKRLLAIDPALSMDELADIIRWVLSQWGVGDAPEVDGESPNDPAPVAAGEASTSSQSGD